MLRNSASILKSFHCVLRQEAISRTLPKTQGLVRRCSSYKKTFETDTRETNLNNDHEITEKLDRHFQQKFSLYRDEDSSVILDQLEEQQNRQHVEQLEDEEELISPNEDPFYGLNLQRGISGVFDVDMLVEVLKGEKAKDICVIQIPKEKRYANHMIICSALSNRHLLALTAFIKKLYKKKKHVKDPFVIVDGESSKTWKAMDMNNIVLHLFVGAEREKYDLESLWCVDPEFDEKSQIKELEMLDKFEEHLKYLEQANPTNVDNSKK
ncbi:hypothetical protein CHUAL_000660 [Chamberlinius hualienensis]